MASKRENVVRVLLHIAGDLEDRRYPMAGVVRQLAREVAQLPEMEVAEGACGCGAPVVQPRTGRPRKFCFSCSPRKRPEKGTVVVTAPEEERA